MNDNIYRTQFDEQVTTSKSVQFNILPQAGDSIIRNNFSLVGTATRDIVGGELKLSTGTGSTGYAKVVTKERGEYIAGSEIESGVGVRCPSTLEPGQYLQWGYYDSENGFGWRYDSDGIKTFKRVAGVSTFVSQSDWNIDPFTYPEYGFDITTGSVYLTKFAWYGYGDDLWRIAKTGQTEMPYDATRKIKVVHRERYHENGTSIEQPNLPITVEVDNNGVADNSIDMYVGGRQVSILNSVATTPQRKLVNTVEDYTLSVGDGVWEPIISLQNAPRFKGTENGINIRLSSLKVSADKDATFRVTLDADVTGSTWSVPDTYTVDDSAAQIAKTGSISIGTTDGFLVPPYVFVGSSGGPQTSDESTARGTTPIGTSGSLTVWAKAPAASTTTVQVALAWSEGF